MQENVTVSITTTLFVINVQCMYLEPSLPAYMPAGDLPYTELAHTVIVSTVVAGYRLDAPKRCSDHM